MEGQQQQQQELEGNYGQRADEQVAPAGGNQAAVAPVPNLLHGGADSGGRVSGAAQWGPSEGLHLINALRVHEVNLDHSYSDESNGGKAKWDLVIQEMLKMHHRTINGLCPLSISLFQLPCKRRMRASKRSPTQSGMMLSCCFLLKTTL